MTQPKAPPTRRPTLIVIDVSRAACRDDWGLFFSPDHERKRERVRRVAAAQRVCAECPLQRECLAGARERREAYGVWGGEDFEAAHRGSAQPVVSQAVAVLEPCGTPAAARRHSRNDEPVDEACRRAAAQAKAKCRTRPTMAKAG